MKTIIKSFILGFITLIGCSCTPEDYTNGNRSYHQVNQDDYPQYEAPVTMVIETMKGEYFDVESLGKYVSIEQDYITVKVPEKDINEVITVEDTDITGVLNCSLLITFSNGSTIELLLGWHPPKEGEPVVRNLLAIKLNGVFVEGLFLSKVNEN